MPRINPEGRITRKERLVTVIAVASAVLLHVVAIFGVGRMYRWAQEEQKKERLMVIRRVRDTAPPRETVERPPRQAPAAPEGKVGGGEKTTPPPPAPPDPKVREEGPEPPKDTEPSPAMERDLDEIEPGRTPPTAQSESTVSVVTDLPAASFIVNGPAQYRGSGTYWVRKGAPPGTYTVTFNPVAGFATPSVQTKELAATGQIAFLGKYRRSTEVAVDSNVPGARVTVYSPGGRATELVCPARVVLDDLPPGAYTAVFKDVPGHVTPPPATRKLVPGGSLSFYGEYRKLPEERATVARSAGQRPGGGFAKGAASGSGGSGDSGGKPEGRRTSRSQPNGGGLDRRVQVVVSSSPPSDIEEDHGAIPYPEVVIQKSNFQQGWCQVYLVLNVSARGEIQGITVERPRPEDRPRFEPLIRAVESAVRSWDYDRVRAEVHVDARFYVE